MARKPSSGDLYESIAFQSRTAVNPDSPADLGNTEDEFVTQFSRRGAYIHLRGGEQVLGARLQGVHTQVIRVGSDTSTRAVTTDWCIVDNRSGDEFNIRDITPSIDRHWIDFLVQKGVAT